MRGEKRKGKDGEVRSGERRGGRWLLGKKEKQ